MTKPTKKPEDWKTIDNVHGVPNARILQLAGGRLRQGELQRLEGALRVRPEDLARLESKGIDLSKLSVADEIKALAEVRDHDPYVGTSSEPQDEIDRVKDIVRNNLDIDHGQLLIKIDDYQFFFRSPDVDHIYVEFGDSVFKFATDGRQVYDDACEYYVGAECDVIRSLIISNYYTFRDKINEYSPPPDAVESDD